MQNKKIGAILLTCFFITGTILCPLPIFNGFASAATTKNEATKPDNTAVRDEKPYLDSEEIAVANQLMREKNSGLTDLLTFPASLTQSELQHLITETHRDFQSLFLLGSYCDATGKPILTKTYQQAKDNCNLDALPDSIFARYAVTTERTNLKLLPTHKNYFDDRDFRHYDGLQGTVLNPAEPVIVLWESRDRAFAFVRARNYTGWASLGSIAFTNRDTWERYVNPEHFLVVTAAQKKW